MPGLAQHIRVHGQAAIRVRERRSMAPQHGMRPVEQTSPPAARPGIWPGRQREAANRRTFQLWSCRDQHKGGQGFLSRLLGSSLEGQALLCCAERICRTPVHEQVYLQGWQGRGGSLTSAQQAKSAKSAKSQNQRHLAKSATRRPATPK